jgi:hypothetical protein
LFLVSVAAFGASLALVCLVSGCFFCGPACCLPAAVSDFYQASSCFVPVFPVVLLLDDVGTFVFFVLGSLVLAVG